MMHVAKKEGRISDPTVLQIDLDALYRKGITFSDCNAARRDASLSARPDQVHFEVIKAGSVFAVPSPLRKFYQAEILVPSPIPPEYIIFPKTGKSPRR